MKRPITFISSISFILFGIAIVVFVTGIVIDKKNGAAAADARFDSLVEATSAASARNECGTPEFSAQFIKAIGAIEDFSSLNLLIRNQAVYSYPPEGFYLPSPGLVRKYSRTVRNIYGTEISLSAAIYLMKPDSIYKYARISFVFILLGTAIAVVPLAVLKDTEKSPQSKKPSQKQQKYESYLTHSPSIQSFENGTEKPTEQGSHFSYENKPEYPPQQNLHETDAKKPDVSADPEEMQADEETKMQDEPIFNPDFFEQDSADEMVWDEDAVERTDTEDDDFDIIDQLERENEQIFGSSEMRTTQEQIGAASETRHEEESANTTIKTDNPVFVSDERNERSPITNLFMQSFLAQKLETVIQRDEATGQDTSVILMKINGLDRGNIISTKIVAILEQFLGANVQIFEYKADGYAIVAENTTLNESVKKFERIYAGITEFLKNNNAANEVSIGISSAAHRTLSSDRLIMEADKALEHAEEDPDSPIIAFRANPEKYKEVIENR